MESYWERVKKGRVGRRRLIAGGASLTLSAAFLAACGGDDDSGSSSGGGSGSSSGGSSGSSSGGSSGSSGGSSGGGSGAAAGGPTYGGTHGQTYGSSDNMSILHNASEYAGLGGQFVYDHLISTRTNERSPYVLEAAESLDQPDEVTLTFKLRQGMKYHNIAPVNGREVVSEDIKLSQEFTGAQEGIENNFQLNFLDRVETPDKYTVIYKLKEPRAYLFDSRILGHPGPQGIIPHETFDGLRSERQVGSGPFILDEWTINTRYHYVRNPEYHSYGQAPGTLPYRDATDVLIITDAAAFEAAFRSEQITYYIPAAGQFDSVSSSIGDLAVASIYDGLNPFSWNMNVRKEPFNDIRFREAVYRGTNRSQFIDLIYGGNALEPTGILSVAMKAYNLDASETAEYYKYDPAEGKKLIDAMNWQKRDIPIMFSGSGTNMQGAEVLKQQLLEIGVTLTADQTQGISEMSPRTQTGQYDMFIGGHPGYDTPSVPMRHNHSNPIHQFAVSGLVDPTLDAMIEKAERTTNFEENIKLVKEAQLYAIQHYTSYYNIASPKQRGLLNAKIQDWEVEASNVAMHRSELWFKDA